MNSRDVTFFTTDFKERPAYTCLLTGRPCGLVPVVLRRLLIIPPLPVLFLSSAVVKLPLVESPSLGVCQYARFVRPWAIVLGSFFFALFLIVSVEPKPGSPLEISLWLSVLAIAVAAWIAVSRWLNRTEFVRILRCSKATGSVTVRFSTASMAQKAREALIWPEASSPDSG